MIILTSNKYLWNVRITLFFHILISWNIHIFLLFYYIWCFLQSHLKKCVLIFWWHRYCRFSQKSQKISVMAKKKRIFLTEMQFMFFVKILFDKPWCFFCRDIILTFKICTKWYVSHIYNQRPRINLETNEPLYFHGTRVYCRRNTICI